MIGETALQPAKPSPDVDIQSIPLPVPQPSIPLAELPMESPLMNIFPPPVEVSDSDNDDVIAIGTEPRRALSVSSKDSRSSHSCKSSKSRSSSPSSSSYRSSSSSSERSDCSKKKKKRRKRKASVLQEKHTPERKRSSSRSPSRSPRHDSEQEIKKSNVDHTLSETQPEIVQLVRSPSKQSEDKPSVSRSRSRSAERRSKSPEKHKSPKPSSRSPKSSKSSRRSKSPRRSKTSRSRSRDRRSGSRLRHRRKRSRDRKDSARSDNGHASGRRRSRSRSKTRKRKSRSRERRRSRDRKSRSRDRKKRSRSRSKSRRHRDRGRRDRKRNRPHERRHSRSRSRRRRSRDRKRSNRRSKSRTPPKKGRQITFKEMMKQQLKQVAEGNMTLSNEDIKALMSAEKPSCLPLNSSNPLLAMATGPGGKVTPQQALLQTMAAMHQKAQQLTGVAVPKYYNPAAVNPLKYAEQVQKRKLLWSKTKDHKEETEAQWGGTSFAQDQDGRVAAKFRKLMGMKDSEEAAAKEEELAEEQRKKHEELFSRLDKEYESARMATHTHRGVGFGFQSGMSGYQLQQNRTEKK